MGEIVDRMLVIVLLSVAAAISGHLSGFLGFLLGAFAAVLCFAYLEQRARWRARLRVVCAEVHASPTGDLRVGSLGTPVNEKKGDFLQFWYEADKWH